MVGFGGAGELVLAYVAYFFLVCGFHVMTEVI